MPRFLVATTAPPLRPATKREVRDAATLFLLALGLCVILFIIALILLRAHRRRLARAAGMAGPANPAKARLDPWIESARRVDVPDSIRPTDADTDDGDDTVDLDPGDIGPDDIEPRDSPHNGTGTH